MTPQTPPNGFTGQAAADLYVHERCSLAEIAYLFEVSAGAVRNALKRLGVPRRSKREAALAAYERGFIQRPVGERNGRWSRSGRRINKGYVYLRMEDGTWRAEHEVVWEWESNMRLPEGFTVHHWDLNRQHNDFSNLYALSNTDHAKLHHALGTGFSYEPNTTRRRRHPNAK